LPQPKSFDQLAEIDALGGKPHHKKGYGDKERRSGKPLSLSAGARDQQSRTEDQTWPSECRRDRLQANVLEERSQQVLLLTMVPSIETHGTAAVTLKIFGEQVHHGTLARAPTTADRESQRRLAVDVAKEARQAHRKRLEAQRIGIFPTNWPLGRRLGGY
jgi:hypothetical protein